MQEWLVLATDKGELDNLKKSIVSLLLMISLLITSCSLEGFTMRKEFFSNNDRKIASESFEKIIVAIEEQDKDTLESLFSEKALNNAESIDESIEELFQFYQGEMLSYNISSLGRFGGRNVDGRGYILTELQSTINVETDKKKYHFAIQEFTEDTEFPENVGIYSIYVVETDVLDEPTANWWMEDGVWIPGVAIGQKRSVEDNETSFASE